MMLFVLLGMLMSFERCRSAAITGKLVIVSVSVNDVTASTLLAWGWIETW